MQRSIESTAFNASTVLVLLTVGLLSSKTAFADKYFTIRDPDNPSMCVSFATGSTGNGSYFEQSMAPCDGSSFSYSYFEQVDSYLVFANDSAGYPLASTIKIRKSSFRDEANCLIVKDGYDQRRKKATKYLAEGLFSDQRRYPDTVNNCDGWQVGEVIRSAKHSNLCLGRKKDTGLDRVELHTCDGSASQRWLIQAENPPWASAGAPGRDGQTVTEASSATPAPPAPPADPNEKDIRGDTELHRLVRARNLDGIRDALERGGDPSIKNASGMSPAEEAARLENGDEIVVLLLGESVSVGTTDGRGMGVMTSLLERSADVNAVSAALARTGRLSKDDFHRLVRNSKYKSLFDEAIIATDDPSGALTTAVMVDDLHLATRVMALRSVKPTRQHVVTALQQASMPVLISLLENGGPPDFVLTQAIGKQDMDLAELAYQYGATPSSKQMDEANRIGNKEMISLLLSFGGDGEEALTQAIFDNNRALINELVSSGVIIGKKDFFYRPVIRNDLSMIRFLIERGGSVQHAMEEAIGRCAVDIVRALYDEFDVIASGRHLELALGGGSGCSVRELAAVVIDNGADPQAGMMMALRRNGYIDLLVERGATARPKELMEYAVDNMKTGAIRQLMEHGAYLPPTFGDGTSIFHKLFEECDEFTSNFVDYLVKAGIDLNVRAPGSGDTPLHVAARNPNCSYWMDDFIISAKWQEQEHGAMTLEINARNNAGKTPRGVARGKRNKKILKHHGAR